jgi:fructokinase
MSFKMIGIGEVLWDLLPSGPQLGGAPANFAYHAHALGASAQIITRVGDDRFGHEIIEQFRKMNLPDDLVQLDNEAPTGTVTVTLDGNGVPEFIIHENVAWDRLAATSAALEAVQAADAICFGSLAQRDGTSRQAIQRLAASAPASAWRIFDINLRQHFFTHEIIEHSLTLANVLKLNDSELPIVAEMFGVDGSIRCQIESLAQRFNLLVVALTRGPEGSLLFQEGRWSELPAEKVEIKDTVGAGDAFTAALCLGLLGGMGLDEINAAANRVAAFVCSCNGATPSMPESLRNMFAHAQHRGFGEK